MDSISHIIYVRSIKTSHADTAVARHVDVVLLDHRLALFWSQWNHTEHSNLSNSSNSSSKKNKDDSSVILSDNKK